uniref:Peptidase M13 N-terminal domain-containing protein n=1 Tax=Romanomermis culicivorax TaxID=13658 RepID=A0A915L1J5_ROMCU
MSFSCIIIAYVVASLLISPKTLANHTQANLDDEDEFPNVQFHEHLYSWSDNLSENSTDDRKDACQSFYEYSCGRWSEANLHKNYTQKFGSYSNEFEHSLKLFNFGLLHAIKNIKLESNYTKIYEKSVKVQKDCRKVQVLALSPVADWSETKIDKKHLADQLAKFPRAQKLNFSQIRDKVDEMSQFRREIRKIFDLYGRTERKIKIHQLKTILPYVDWKSYFQKLYPTEQNFYQTLSENNAEIILKGEKYLKILPHILEKYDKRSLIDLAYSQMMRNVFKNLKDNVVQPRRIWQKFENQDDKCLDLVLKFFTPASIRIYFDRALKIDLNFWRSDIDSMMQAILSAFKFSLSGLDWLDKREKSLLIKKVKRIQFYSGLPDWLTDDRRLDEKTPRVEYDSQLFETGMQMERKKFLERLRPILDRRAAFEDPDPVLETDAVYRLG